MHPSTPPISSCGLEDGFEYLSEPNENLICPICRNPFIDPVMCESTDHVFCRICLIRSLELSSTCPIDRLPLSLSLITPAPKIIVKLVDELLVSCPFKSKLDCSFICQRDLMSAHVRSHQSQLYHPPSIAPHQASEISAQPHELGQRLSSRSSSRLRFQWLSGRATLVEEPPSQGPIPDEPHKQSDSLVATTNTSGSTSYTTQRSDDASHPLAHCPFEQFGCQFIGTPETIRHKHLSAVPFANHLVASPDPARCPFSFVQDILKSFQNLERRNTELKQQLSHSLVKQDELTSVIQNLKSSFRQLWLSHQPTITDQPFTACSARVPPLIKSPHHPSICTVVGNTCPSTSDSCTLPRRSSDGSLPMYSSRLNYDTTNGHRLKHFNHHLPSHPCQCQPVASPPSSSNSSTFGRNIRVSTFVRKGEVVTPTTQIHKTVLPLDTPTTSLGSDQPSYNVGFDQPSPNSLRIIRESCSKSESSTSDHPAVNSLSIPQVIQMIQTIHDHLDNNHSDNKPQPEDLTTNSTIHSMKMLDNLKEIKKLLEDLVGRGIEESETKKVERRNQEENNPDSLSTSSSKFSLSAGLSSSDHFPSGTNINMTGSMDHLDAHPIDRRNSPHLKL